jgi:hypothetical protein
MGTESLSLPPRVVIIRYDPDTDTVSLETTCSPAETREIISMAADAVEAPRAIVFDDDEDDE